MLHPSYTDLMNVVNSEVEEGEQLVVQSRYSIVIATAKRARQIIDEDNIEDEDAIYYKFKKKSLSRAIEELNAGKVKIVSDEDILEDDVNE